SVETRGCGRKQHAVIPASAAQRHALAQSRAYLYESAARSRSRRCHFFRIGSRKVYRGDVLGQFVAQLSVIATRIAAARYQRGIARHTLRRGKRRRDVRSLRIVIKARPVELTHGAYPVRARAKTRKRVFYRALAHSV